MENTTFTITVKVADRIASIGSTKVVDSVVDQLATKEINRRSEILVRAMALGDSLTREVRRASRPDQIAINPTTGKRTETFSKNGFENKKKTEEKLTKLDVLITNAIDKNEWDKLNQMLNTKDGNSNNQESDQQSSE